MFRVSKRTAFKPKATLALCKCDHPLVAHYRQDGSCVLKGCGCMEFRGKPRTKYNNVKSEAKGEHFDSKHEMKSITDLRYLIESGEADFEDLRRQIPFHFFVNGVKICTYVADAVVTVKDTGKQRVFEPKGMKTETYRIKQKLMQALYPEVELIEIV